eukprot:269174-Pelagomonas_calceolata.AAC.2
MLGKKPYMKHQESLGGSFLNARGRTASLNCQVAGIKAHVFLCCMFNMSVRASSKQGDACNLPSG